MAKDNNNTGKIVLYTVGGLIAFSIVRELLENLGLWQSKESKDYDQEKANPYSFWNPLFWRQGGEGTLLLTNAKCQWLYNEIYESFGFFNDDESRIYSAFKTLKTQSQLSYFSWWLQNNKGTDLLDWLKGTNTGPIGDHLDTEEISVITNYFKQLPKYK